MLIFFNCTATTEIYTLSLHDALPIFALEHCRRRNRPRSVSRQTPSSPRRRHSPRRRRPAHASTLARRSEEHTSELQSRQYLVCRLLLEKKKQKHQSDHI